MSSEKPKDGFVRAGQVLRLLPQFYDEGDEEFEFIAVDDEEKGRVLVQVQVDLPIKPTQIVYSYMIDRARSGERRGAAGSGPVQPDLDLGASQRL